jgi:N-acetylmuramoyl-L-alanine amidase
MRWILGLAMALCLTQVQAGELRDLRLWDGPDSTRVVFDLDSQAENNVFSLGTSRAPGLTIDQPGKGIVKSVRSGPRENGLRVVLDLNSAASPRSFVLPPSGGYGYRLILDLYPEGAGLDHAAPLPAAPASAPSTISAEAGPAPLPAPTQVAAAVPSPGLRLAQKPIVVAVDAGHGGEDPGARGPGGLEEKVVTLAIARKLAARIDAEPGMRAVLTRDGDYYVDLRERTVKARQAQADLFVSIHANSAYQGRDMSGTAVYVLSEHGASSEQARWEANHENDADLVGGVDLHDKDDKLAAVLIDISQSATMDASFDLGGRLLDSLRQVNNLERPHVQQAGFMVLKSPDIPSVLVETDYISNPREERKLGDARYQDAYADAIFEGIKSYFSRYRPMQQVADTGPERAHAMPVKLNRGGGGASD